ncbi:MAG: competence protein ComEA [Thermoleophilaceae bacterium]|jgi:competence protein ComEA|nr:competence protein ComEA [Thermoleophilaceae bacterium]
MPGTTPARLATWIAVGALVLAAGSRLFAQPSPPAGGAPPVRLDPGPGKDHRAERIYVDVAGAVRRPGLYRLPAGARVGQAVERAGGPVHAASGSVNLAAELEDGQQIVVAGRGDVREPAPAATSTSASTSTPAGPATPAGQSAPAGTLSLSTATAEQIDAAAEGIGPTLAARVVEFREQSGGFSSVEQLREVPGIGEARFQALSAVLAP